MDASGRRQRRCCIDKDHRIEIRPLHHQRQHVGAGWRNSDIGRQKADQFFYDDGADAIIATIRVSQTHHEHSGRRRLFHVRWTDSLRKCVEQEIQGS